MSKKKLLILADWYEPGYKAGGPIQSVKNFIIGMHELFDIAVLTADTDLGEAAPYEGITANEWIERAPGIMVYYATRSALNSARIEALINDVRPDFIYLNSMYSVRFAILPLMLLWRNKITAQVVLSPRGMLRASAIQSKSGRKKLFIGLLNRLHIPQRLRIHATDAQEEKDIRLYFPRAKEVKRISNFSAPLPSELVQIEKIPGFLNCVFISRIMGIKNLLFLLDVLKQVPASAQIGLNIYGEIEDAAYWQESEKLIAELPAHIHVRYFGSLPHARVIPTMEENHLFVLPTKGENFGHAIFEALSAGRPVLISDRTPWLDLKEKGVGWDLSLDNPRGWVDAVLEAAGWDQAAFDHNCLNSRQFAGSHLDERRLTEEYSRLFN